MFYDSNLRIRIPRTSLYTYPDVNVVCGDLQYDPNDEHEQTVINPQVLVEVLSPSTEGYDRGENFARYRKLDSLREYVLVNQHRASVESFFRLEDGMWRLNAISGLESKILLASLHVELSLAEIYSGVVFPPEEPDSP